jgi:hypothetical protein
MGLQLFSLLSQIQKDFINSTTGGCFSVPLTHQYLSFSVMFCNLFCTYYWGGDLQAITTRIFIVYKGNSICDFMCNLCYCASMLVEDGKKTQIEFAIFKPQSSP